MVSNFICHFYDLSLPGPMVLLSEDDVVEEVEDKDVLTGPPYKLPSLPHTSLSKDLIFVERRGLHHAT